MRETGKAVGEDTYGGVAGIFVLEADLLVPSSTSPQTSSVCVFMHPCAAMNMLPMPIGLARCGLHVLICSSRYAGNDSEYFTQHILGTTLLTRVYSRALRVHFGPQRAGAGLRHGADM